MKAKRNEPFRNADEVKKEIYDAILEVWSIMKEFGFERELSQEELNELVCARYNTVIALKENRTANFYRKLFTAMADYYEDCYLQAKKEREEKEDQ